MFEIPAYWTELWTSSLLVFLVGYPWCFNLMLPVQTESRWSIGCCHDRMWSIAMFAPGRGIFWALVICPRLDCWRIARFKLDSCKLTWLLVGFIHLQSPKRCWDLVVGNLGNSANQEEPVLLWDFFFFLRLPNFETLVKKVMDTQVSWCQPGFRVGKFGFFHAYKFKAWAGKPTWTPTKTLKWKKHLFRGPYPL